jgi:hypothetical protein
MLKHSELDGEDRRSIDPPAYTIPEFCTTHKVSRSMLYKMWANGSGPRAKSVGVKKIITAEAAAEWRRQP